MARKKQPRRRRRGTGTIRHRPERAKPYEAAFPIGHGQYRVASFATWEDATAYLDRLTAERDDTARPRDIAGGSQRLDRFLTDWLSIKSPHIKAKTLAIYTYHCELTIGYFGGDRRIDTITRRDADLFYVHLHTQRFKDVAELRAVIGQAFAYAEDEDMIRTNPFRRAKAPPVERTPRIALTLAQRAHLLDLAAGSPLEALWHLYSRLGLRRGEGIGLLWANIDFAAATVTITQQYTSLGGEMVKSTPKTRRSRRTIPIPADLLDLLRAHQRRQREQAARTEGWTMTGLVFTNERGERLTASAVYYHFKKLARRAGLDRRITVHDLRHSALHILEDSGTPLSVVQAIAGHSSAAMTRHYTDHASLDAMRQAIERTG